MVTIPDQLTSYPLIRVCRPDCRSHDNCNKPGKRPVTSVKDDDHLNRIKSWINRNGNYGIVAKSSNDLVIFDSDSEAFSDLLDQHLPSTFRVQSGGSDHGQHWYYRCSKATNQQGWRDPEGSVRVANWHAVGPKSVHSVTGDEYQVVENKPIAEVGIDDLRAVYNELNERDTASTDDGVKRGGGGGSGSSGSPPSAHSAVSDLDFIKRDDRRAEISEILQTDSKHTRRVWMVGWLHGAAGLTQSEIANIIMRNARWSNLDREIVECQVESVIDSSNSGRGTHYSEWGYTADMDGNTSERRKTENESDGLQPSTQEVNNMEGNEDNVRNKVTVKRDNGQFARGGIVQVENNGDEWEYAGVVFGQIEDEDDELGQVVEFETNQYGDRDYRNIGDRSPEELRLAAEALEELADELEG